MYMHCASTTCVLLTNPSSRLFNYLINFVSCAVLHEEQPFIGCDMHVYVVYLCTRLPNDMTKFMYQYDILTVCFLLILFT